MVQTHDSIPAMEQPDQQRVLDLEKLLVEVNMAHEETKNQHKAEIEQATIDFEKKYEEKNKLIVNLSEELSSKKELLEQRDKTISTMKMDFAENYLQNQNALKVEKDAREKMEEDLKNELKMTQEKLAETEENLDSERKEHEFAQKSLKTKDKEIEEVNETNNTLKDEIKEFKDQNEGLNNTISTLKTEDEANKKLLEEHMEQLKMARESLKEKDGKIEEMAQTNDTLKDQIKELKGQNEGLDGTISILKTEDESNKKLIKVTQEKLTKLEEELEEIKAKNQQNQQELKEKDKMIQFMDIAGQSAAQKHKERVAQLKENQNKQIASIKEISDQKEAKVLELEETLRRVEFHLNGAKGAIGYNKQSNGGKDSKPLKQHNTARLGQGMMYKGKFIKFPNNTSAYSNVPGTSKYPQASVRNSSDKMPEARVAQMPETGAQLKYSREKMIQLHPQNGHRDIHLLS